MAIDVVSSMYFVDFNISVPKDNKSYMVHQHCE